MQKVTHPSFKGKLEYLNTCSTGGCCHDVIEPHPGRLKWSFQQPLWWATEFRALSVQSIYGMWSFRRCKNNKAHQLHRNLLSQLKYFLPDLDLKCINATILRWPHWNEWDLCATSSHLHPLQVLKNTKQEIQQNVPVVVLKSWGCSVVHLGRSVLWGER